MEIQESLDYIVKNMVTKSEFNGLENKVEKIDTRLISVEMDVQNLKTNSLEIRNTIDNAFGKLDAFVKKMDTETMERTALHHKVDRHDGWIHDIAKEADVKLV